MSSSRNSQISASRKTADNANNRIHASQAARDSGGMFFHCKLLPGDAMAFLLAATQKNSAQIVRENNLTCTGLAPAIQAPAANSSAKKTSATRDIFCPRLRGARDVINSAVKSTLLCPRWQSLHKSHSRHSSAHHYPGTGPAAFHACPFHHRNRRHACDEDTKQPDYPHVEPIVRPYAIPCTLSAARTAGTPPALHSIFFT